jgi:hypothetical protein
MRMTQLFGRPSKTGTDYEIAHTGCCAGGVCAGKYGGPIFYVAIGYGCAQ